MLENRNILILPKVSVVIAVYNAEAFLRQCLDSVLAQRLRDIEIICVNDGSTDGSLQILREYEQKDSRVIVIDQENRGAGAARTAGLHAATGEFLSFLDSDDFFEDNMLEEAYRYARVADADVCVFASDRYVHNEDRYEPCPWAFRQEFFPLDEPFDPSAPKYRNRIYRMFIGWAWDKLFRRSFINEHGLEFQNLRTTNDMFFVYMALSLARRIVCTDQVLIHQRVEVTTSLSRNREKSWDCFYIALVAMQDALKASGLYETYKRAFVNWVVNFTLWQLRTMTGEAHEKAAELMRTKGFAQLDVTDYPEDKFFSKKEYAQYKEIMMTEETEA